MNFSKEYHFKEVGKIFRELLLLLRIDLLS